MRLFDEAGLDIIYADWQTNWPKEMLPVIFILSLYAFKLFYPKLQLIKVSFFSIKGKIFPVRMYALRIRKEWFLVIFKLSTTQGFHWFTGTLTKCIYWDRIVGICESKGELLVYTFELIELINLKKRKISYKSSEAF